MYCFFRNLLKPFIMFLYQVKIEGKEHIPTDSSAILAPNHRSNWDPLWVAFITNRFSLLQAVKFARKRAKKVKRRVVS